MKLIELLILICCLFTMSCAPNIYFLDRQTMIETEAAGEWPEFDKELFAGSIKIGATDFVTVPNDKQRKRMYNLLNGEFVSQRK